MSEIYYESCYSGTLAHHGIKGQKWGIRRYQNRDSTRTAEGLKRYRAKRNPSKMTDEEIEKSIERMALEKRYKEARAEFKAKPKSPSDKMVKDQINDISKEITKSTKYTRSPRKIAKMSEKELNDAIDRMKLEQSYKKMLDETRDKDMSKTKKFVSDIVSNSAKNIATQTVTYFMGYAVNQLAKKAGHKNATKTIKDENGVEQIVDVFEDIVNPKKGQKDK